MSGQEGVGSHLPLAIVPLEKRRARLDRGRRTGAAVRSWARVLQLWEHEQWKWGSATEPKGASQRPYRPGHRGKKPLIAGGLPQFAAVSWGGLALRSAIPLGEIAQGTPYILPWVVVCSGTGGGRGTGTGTNGDGNGDGNGNGERIT